MTGLGPHIDFVFILDKGMFALAADPLKTGRWGTLVFYAAPPIEGVHIVTEALELEVNTLYAFILTLLSHLQFFRHVVDHPGFKWATEQTGKKVRITYLTTLTRS
jgi:hypothetical protein